MISLENLLAKFKPLKNVEYEGRLFMTNVPSRGSLAYLNIVFKAAAADAQQEIIDPLRLPGQLRAFYRSYNGAHLFSDLLSLYGFLPTVYLIERENRWKSLPYNIKNVNEEYFDNWLTSSVIVVGSYGFDRSEVFVDKFTGQVFCSVADDLSRIRAVWPSFETWITEEIGRLSDCFDERGNCLVELEETLPRE